VVHETAHQWYGDDVIIKRWSDICLNECFASYAPWLYHQDVDGTDLDALWKSQMADVSGDPSFWSVPLVDMGAGNEFSSVYDRGPLAVHALRHEMGEKAFAELLKGWISTYGGRKLRRPGDLRLHAGWQGSETVHGRLVPSRGGAARALPDPARPRLTARS
jgi:aminopeptidase N